MEYKTIARRCEARFIEKKSEFIGYLCPVQTEEQAVAFIEEIRAMHRRLRTTATPIFCVRTTPRATPTTANPAERRESRFTKCSARRG